MRDIARNAPAAAMPSGRQAILPVAGQAGSPVLHHLHRSIGNRAVAGQARVLVDGAPQSLPASAMEVLSAPGTPLDSTARAFMEEHLGADFGSVRVHRDHAAADAARDLGTRAWTAGEHVVFGAGAYGIDSRANAGSLVHELTHVLEHRNAAGDDVRIDRQPPGWNEDFLLDQGIPAKGMDPLTGLFLDGHDDRHATERYLRAQRQGMVYKPHTVPSLPAVKEAMSVAGCGTVTPGMDAAKAEVIRNCITHSRFVNIMNQSAANIAAVPSTYSEGIAALYRDALKQITSSTAVPTDTAGVDYATTSTSVRVSSATTIPLTSFTVRLEHKGTGAPNGSWSVLTNKLELNETSTAAIMQDQPDVERTMYHEMVHFLSDATTFAAKNWKPGSPVIEEPALMSSLTAGYKSSFVAAVKPFFTDMLSTVTLSAKKAGFNADQLALIQWLRVENEMISRVEEEIYLALRAGRGFGLSDMRALPQKWLTQTPAYWDSTGEFDETSLDAYLKKNVSRIEKDVLPVVQNAQERYMYYRRPW